MSRLTISIILCLLLAGCNGPDFTRKGKIIKKVSHRVGISTYSVWTTDGWGSEEFIAPSSLAEVGNTIILEGNSFVVTEENNK